MTPYSRQPGNEVDLRSKDMKTKKVNRYYCDFCKKANCSASAMALHERHCTMNPNRICRMCKKPRSIPEIVKLLPSHEPFLKVPGGADIEGWGETFSEPLKAVREECDHCPACTLAVLRQSKIPLYVFNFDYKKESEEWFEDIREQDQRAEEYAAIYG